jgi:hypothetical protein
MIDAKTLKVLDEALDIALANLIEENAMDKTSPYVQKFVKAQKVVRREIEQSAKIKSVCVKRLNQRS